MDLIQVSITLDNLKPDYCVNKCVAPAVKNRLVVYSLTGALKVIKGKKLIVIGKMAMLLS